MFNTDAINVGITIKARDLMRSIFSITLWKMRIYENYRMYNWTPFVACVIEVITESFRTTRRHTHGTHWYTYTHTYACVSACAHTHIHTHTHTHIYIYVCVCVCVCVCLYCTKFYTQNECILRCYKEIFIGMCVFSKFSFSNNLVWFLGGHVLG